MNQDEIIKQALAAIAPTLEETIKAAAKEAAGEAVGNLLNAFGGAIGKALETATTEAARIGAEIGAKSAVEAVEKERKKFKQGRYDKRFRNTKLLLRNYNTLSQHCTSAVYNAASKVTEGQRLYGENGADDILEALNDILEDDLQVESIMKSAARTQIIMEHVNNMLAIYKIYCERSKRQDDKRHYRVIEAVYLDPQPISPIAIATRENIDKRTVYKDIDAACETLSALIFGIDGVHL